MTDPKPLVAPPANTARNAIRICLALGAVALLSGCLAGFESLGNRVEVLALLGCSVALFAAAGAMQLRRPSLSIVDSPAVPPASSQPARSPTAQPTLALAPSPGSADQSRTEASLAHVTTPTQAVQARPVLIAEPPQAEVVPDVLALMRVPLSDLLLAALCKDPVGARRIFAQVALEGNLTDTSPGPRPSSTAAPTAPR